MSGPVATVASPDWRAANCAGADPELFFPRGPQWQSRRKLAIALCCSCPVVEDCLRLALADSSLSGIWGATNDGERSRARSWIGVHPQGTLLTR
jgi:WhiB family redox-sensing transcriptional regulator